MRFKIHLIAALIALGILIAAGFYYHYFDAEKVINMQSYTIPEGCDFSQVINGGFGRDGGGLPGKNQCTPQIQDLKYVGVLINAPKNIRFSSSDTEDNHNAIPVCGIVSHDLGTYIDKNSSLARSVIIVVTDAKSNETWSGRMPGPQNLVPKPKPIHGKVKKFTREDVKGRIIRQTFNPNLFNVTGMELRETEYIVYATVGPYKSNVVVIKAIKE